MGFRPQIANMLAALVLLSAFIQPASGQILKGPITETKGTTDIPGANADSMAGLGAPGSDAVMTQDMLMVNPNSDKSKPALPVTGYIGMTLKLDVERKVIKYKDLKGLSITVSNQTNRPLVISADEAVAKLGDKAYKCSTLVDVQLTVRPPTTLKKAAVDLVTEVAPAAASIGAIPTIEDFYKYSKPPLTRYGKDQERRVVESSRFAKRILWPGEKTQGIIYFDSKAAIENATIEIPVATLFDKKDSGILVSNP